jgi:hypothetical protein
MMKCPVCGKVLGCETAHKIETVSCCGMTIDIFPDAETPVSIFDEDVRADLYESGEGYYGVYNPSNPDDEELLRFDIYKKEEGNWIEVDDASYCTLLPAKAKAEQLIKPLYIIFKEYRNADLDYSVKKLGERLSWISLEV